MRLMSSGIQGVWVKLKMALSGTQLPVDSVFEESIVSPKVRQKFSQMLFDADIHGLAGRVLLLVARETCEPMILVPVMRLILTYSRTAGHMGALSQ